MRKIPNGKVVGPDGVPAETFKYSAKAKDVLFQIIEQVWEEERVPTCFGEANLKILFKKEDVNDPTKYRCIGLLNHV